MIEIRELIIKAEVNQRNRNQQQALSSKHQRLSSKTQSVATLKKQLEQLQER